MTRNLVGYAPGIRHTGIPYTMLDIYTELPYGLPLHTVVETPRFLKSAAEVGMSPREVESLITILAKTPHGGVVIEGTGGFRKLRVPGRGKGKSGGYRVVTFYSGKNIPVLLIDVFSKGEKENLSKAERNALLDMSKKIVEAFRPRVVQLRSI